MGTSNIRNKRKKTFLMADTHKFEREEMHEREKFQVIK